VVFFQVVQIMAIPEAFLAWNGLENQEMQPSKRFVVMGMIIGMREGVRLLRFLGLKCGS
jgi:hypothetical protein